MVKKLGHLTSLLFTSSEASLSSSASSTITSFSTAASWQWPSCTQARTLSFRCDSPPEIASSMRHQSHSNKEDEDWCFKTSMMNPAYMLLDPSDSSESLSLCTAAEAVIDEDEAIVRSLRRSNDGRLLFEPESTSSIVKKKAKAVAFEGATALAMDSADPYGDFLRSMEEMVMSHGVNNDWGWLQEMLGWYLSANGKNTHGLIVGAFVDMLVALTSAHPSSLPVVPPTYGAAKKGKRQLGKLGNK